MQVAWILMLALILKCANASCLLNDLLVLVMLANQTIQFWDMHAKLNFLMH